MDDASENSIHAYHNEGLLGSKDARALRILSEHLEPNSRFQYHHVDDTIVFMGSARTLPREEAEARLKLAENGAGDLERTRIDLKMSQYYEASRTLETRLGEWSKTLDETERRFVICTGGGPGIMEAGNRGASEARGMNVGLIISIPKEEFENKYVTRELGFHSHYFFMRKFWFTYLAKAVVVFPGGYGTLDELFEILTLLQTGKIRKHLPVVLFGTEYWNELVNFDALAKYGCINREDIDLVFRTDSTDDAYEYIVRELTAHAIEEPGASL
ncbi:MAG: lysine decarboxylase [Alphaproteobacteria bacterium]|nr:lysine decarboxylase [Alphaproteobacteria bacterium]|tara:strand:- start:264 stop:1079 length:816 start_codon:yes stop_codon:yes gene_type:complete